MADEIFTLMNTRKDKIILLQLRNTRTLQGILKDFDIHMNLTLEDAKDVTDEPHANLGKILLRGDNILAITMSKE